MPGPPDSHKEQNNKRKCVGPWDQGNGELRTHTKKPVLLFSCVVYIVYINVIIHVNVTNQCAGLWYWKWYLSYGIWVWVEGKIF